MNQDARAAVVRLTSRDAHAAVLVLVAALLAALTLLAARAELQVPASGSSRVGLVVAVGVAFMLAGWLAPAGDLPRVLTVATGAGWLLASLDPATLRLHQGLLLVTLLCLVSGRLHGTVDWVFVAGSAAVALLLVPQPGVVALFTAVAVRAVVRVRVDPAEWFAAASAALVAAVLGTSWVLARRAPQSFDPSVALVSYEAVLLIIAVGVPVAAYAGRAHRTRVVDRVLRGGTAGLPGLAMVLRSVLRDPDLRLMRDGDTDLAADSPPGLRRLEVWDGRTRLATIEHRSPALDDPGTVDGVTQAVRLVALNDLRQEELDAELDRLRAARARLVTSRDRQRGETAARLRQDVVPPLLAAASAVHATSAELPDGEDAATLDLVVDELRATARDVLELVAGVPAAALGDGRLSEAVGELAGRCPVPTDVVVDGNPRAAANIESAVFFVCAELLANAAKHARATHVVIRLSGDAAVLTLVVRDDGVGGATSAAATASGPQSGLQGLTDRLAAYGGGLTVSSPPGGGTIVTATLPGAIPDVAPVTAIRSAPTA